MGALRGSSLGHRALEETLSFQIATGSTAGDYIFLFAIIFFMVLMSALFSGLTLGLLGLDKTGLQIVIGGGSADQKKWAEHVMIVRSDGNRLLCTLLLGNVAVNALLSITLSNLGGGLAGFLVSTALIVIFGEILPQATCSRHALFIGYKTLPITKVFLLLLAPAAVPLGKMLDYVLGEDVGTVHTQDEILQYMDVHLKAGEIEADSSKVMHGALEMKSTSVSDVMTPLNDVYMLPEATTLSFRVIREIFEHGFSRVPVFRGSRQNIVGLLFVKDLIFVDPEDGTPLSEMMAIFSRSIHVVNADDTLDDVLKVFKRGQGHLALVCKVVDAEEERRLEELLLTANDDYSETSLAPSYSEREFMEDIISGELPSNMKMTKSEDGGSSSSITGGRLNEEAPALTPASLTALEDQNFRPPSDMMSAAIEGGIEMRPPQLKLCTIPGTASSTNGDAINNTAALATEAAKAAAEAVPESKERVIVGIVTLEDIIEEIIGDEIIDETDVYVDVDHQIKVAGRGKFDITKLKRLDAEFVDEKLTTEEVDAISAHFLTNVDQIAKQPESKKLTRDKMRQLVRKSHVVERKRASRDPAQVPLSGGADLHTSEGLDEAAVDPQDWIYKKDAPAAFATLILSGKVGVVAGKQGFRSELGPWSVLGADSLVNPEGHFVPDFSAYVFSDCVRCVFVSRADYDRYNHLLHRDKSHLMHRRSKSRVEMVERRKKLAAKKMASTSFLDVDASSKFINSGDRSPNTGDKSASDSEYRRRRLRGRPPVSPGALGSSPSRGPSPLLSDNDLSDAPNNKNKNDNNNNNNNNNNNSNTAPLHVQLLPPGIIPALDAPIQTDEVPFPTDGDVEPPPTDGGERKPDEKKTDATSS